jgi:glutamate synthase domain-containing protein 1
MQQDIRKIAEEKGMYSASNEHDACGVGFVAHIKGKRTHDIIASGLKILENLDHRGAVGADPLMGDGAGILIQIPDAFFRAEMAKQGVTLPPAGEYGVGMLFLPKETASRIACEQEIEPRHANEPHCAFERTCDSPGICWPWSRHYGDRCAGT